MTTQRQLVHILKGKGTLVPEWRDAVASVDRALFIPEVIEGCDFTEDPEEWLRSVYADAPVVTQVNDGRETPADQFRLFTSSSSMPSIMLEMLRLLDVRDGPRVLEIGTGTGYNAAWLSHRLGDSNVTSVELDAAVLKTAVDNLNRAGYHPTTVHGNGRSGYPPLPFWWPRNGAPGPRARHDCLPLPYGWPGGWCHRVWGTA